MVAILVTAGAGWLSEGLMVSSVLAGLSGCWVGAVAHRGCGLPLWLSCFPLTEEGQRYLHLLFLESLQSMGSCLALDRKRFMSYLKCWTRIHSRHFLSSEVGAEEEEKGKNLNKMHLTLGMMKLHT